MKTPAVKVLFASVAAVVLAVGAAGAENAHPLDGYVKDGLIGWWDGEYNSVDENGVPVHKSDATQWQALRGGGVFGPTNTLVFGEKSVTLAGRWLQTTIADMPQDGAIPVTVQIVARCVATANPGQGHQIFHTWHGDWGLITDLNTLTGEARNNGSNFDIYKISLPISMDQVQIDTFVFNNGTFAFDVNLDAVTLPKSTPGGTQKKNTEFSIGSSRTAGVFSYEYFSIRVYNRLLTDLEAIQNASVDSRRFGIDLIMAKPVAVPSVPLTPDSYVQAGLTSQWDGVYNNLVDGTPTHVENPTQWDDLKGVAVPFVNQGNCTFHSDRVTVAKRGSTSVPWLEEPYRPLTLEAAYYCSTVVANAGMDTSVHLASYGGLGWQSVNGLFRLTGSAVNPERTARYGINGPKESECPAGTPRTYSLNVEGDFANLSLDGQTVVIDKGGDKGVSERSQVVYIGSSQTNPCHFDFYSIRLYNRPLTLEERKLNHLVDSVRFYGASLVTNLLVTGESRCIGAPEPNYGAYAGIEAGKVVVCSAPETVRSNKLLGYEVQTNGVDGAWLPWLSGNESRFYYRQPKATVRIVWKWKSSGFMLMVY